MCACVDNRHVTSEVRSGAEGGARAFDLNEREGHLSSTERG